MTKLKDQFEKMETLLNTKLDVVMKIMENDKSENRRKWWSSSDMLVTSFLSSALPPPLYPKEYILIEDKIREPIIEAEEKDDKNKVTKHLSTLD